ncbi:MAG TPA: DMT family transporter [Chitinophagaceae bacterium]|nr:DMT family transporter [Chitinophagaceae bacterium]
MLKKNTLVGISLAVLAALLWSGNFIIARGVYNQIPPISLAFYRWLIASLIIFPFAYKQFKAEKKIVSQYRKYFFWTALTGVTLFNTFVYIGAHYTTAINLALIGTTSSPVFAIILAGIFLKEKLSALKITGMLVCIAGIIFLLCRGDFTNFLSLSFSAGDGWVLLAALTFAIYNTLAKRKPAGIASINFLFVVFTFGTILLFPFYLWELSQSQSVYWNWNLILMILYLGLGTSVIAFLCWNISIQKLGAGRTAMFGNLIPVFSSLEAVLLLNEQFTYVDVISMIVVITGLVLANLHFGRR